MCELTLAIRQRLLESYADHNNPTAGLIDHQCMSAAEGAVEALVRCGLSNGRFRQADVADQTRCAAFVPNSEQERELAHAFFELEVVQHEILPNALSIFQPPAHLLAACSCLAARGDLLAVNGGYVWPLERLTAFRQGLALSADQ